MCKLLKGKTAIITGSLRGMGFTTLQLFAENGADIFALIRKENTEFTDEIKKIAMENKVQIFPIYVDFINEDEIKQAVKMIMSKKIPINILVNNAGISITKLYLMTTKKNVEEQFNINFFAPFILTQSIVKLMVRAGGGSIVNISSAAGIDGISGKAAYGAAKAAIIALTKVIAKEHGKDNIRCNAIAPGVIDTDMLKTMSEDAVKKEIENQDLKKLGKPYDVANASLFLASDLSSYITGEVIRVDGGMR
ncbi:MAG: SDR family oxidoreductase [Clostridiales Family XIII bacterium]|jgi:3-oxoacyl-[acyl-carrier protein] reductase|nr:SDR family oxidoreductase [Clostridiales Family XIII bacterium]